LLEHGWKRHHNWIGALRFLSRHHAVGGIDGDELLASITGKQTITNDLQAQ
jgi:hypothetical protein